MANTTKREDSETSDPDTTSAVEGRQSIHGTNEDYGDRVAERAYELYLSRGRADGRDFDDWLAAERELANHRPGHHRES
jgi:Protein of unknown function (DUF2934)